MKIIHMSLLVHQSKISNLLRLVLSYLFFSIVISNPVAAQADDAQQQRLAWWQEVKFGMFLHWGLYSEAAGEWKGKRYRGNEHFMIYEKLSIKQYATLADKFAAEKFNADDWVKDAKDAGMKYIVITTKHHDGFAMYRSLSSAYNIVKRTPFKKDPMKDLAAACKKYGMRLGFYYSLGRDWEDPDVPTDWPTKGGRSNLVDFPDEDTKDFSKYFERKVKPQIKELLTQYGPIALLWFDTPELITKTQSKELLELIQSLQPECIVNNRIGNGLGDYKVSEQQILAKKEILPWESCITMSKGWGYNRFDTTWKSPELIIRQLVEVVAKGGNLLLNIAPKGDGSFPLSATERLKIIGKWMKVNSEAIYGTIPWVVTSQNVSFATLSNKPVHDAEGDVTSKVILPDIYFTAKEKNVYVIARSWKDPVLVANSMASGKYKIRRVTMLGSSQKIAWKQQTKGLLLFMPKRLPAGIPVYVFKVETE